MPDTPVSPALSAASLAIGLFLAGCGSSETPPEATPPVDGRYEIIGLELDTAEVPLEQAPVMVIDAEFGTLEVLPGCNRHLGSFTLATSEPNDTEGAASFTVTGGTDQSCDDLADQERDILAALADAERWRAVDDGYVFEGPSAALTVSELL